MRQTRKLSKLRKIGIILASLIIILSLILWGGASYLVDFALSPVRSANFATDSWNRQYENYPGMKEWHNSLMSTRTLRDTFIISNDDTKLHAYYIKASCPTPKVAVLIHGYTDNAISMMMLGKMYEREFGCNVFLPDLRYAGLSEGTHIGMGWKDSQDVAQWIRTLPTHFGDSLSVVVHGISMGAATTMMLSGMKDVPHVVAYIEDCGYTDVWSQFSKELQEDFNLPTFPLLHIASWICDIKYGWNFTEASSIAQVAKCQRPMLFIHGDSDKYVPTEMVYPLYETHPGEKELWIVSQTEHALSFKNHPSEYTQHVRNFLGKHAKW